MPHYDMCLYRDASETHAESGLHLPGLFEVVVGLVARGPRPGIHVAPYSDCSALALLRESGRYCMHEHIHGLRYTALERRIYGGKNTGDNRRPGTGKDRGC